MLHREETARHEQAGRGGRGRPREAQPVRSPAVERELGIVLGHLGFGGDGIGRDVGRVGDHDVERGVVLRERRREVPLGQVDTERGEVPRGPRQGQPAQFDGVHLRPRHLVRQRGGDRTGPRPEVHDPRRRERRNAVHHQLDQALRLRPGDEHPGPHGEGDPAEGRGPGEVLQRDAPRTLVDQCLEALGHLRPRERECPEPPRTHPEQVGGEQFGVHARTRHTGRTQPPLRVPQRSLHAYSSVPMASRRACSSISMADCTTGSRSPFITVSRL
ncbi:hypothetical protein AC792_09985 [Arthrobacter sp. RIT-PI-e]|nr:hypothetical protein AC792_09985 [Arthrobacter sp. RIT-PI-e]